MKRIYFNILIAGIFIFLAVPMKAQVSINFGINLSSQPIWGPTGYDAVQYYYLPDIDVYYYVPQHRFYYQSRGRWIYSSNLPYQYRNYNLYSGYKVVINENRPYLRNNVYREKYSSFKNRHDQQPIRDSRDSKYFVNKNHPEHNNWVKQQRHNNVQDNKQVQFKKQGPGKEQANNKKNQNKKQDKKGDRGNQNRNNKK